MFSPDPIVIRSNVPFAARELDDCLTRIRKRPCHAEGEGYVIDIFAEQGIGEGFAIHVDETAARIIGQSVRGAVYGVYAFLTRFCGCRFLAEDCELLPDALRLEAGDYASEPAFDYREVYWRGALDARFALKCFLNSARSPIPDAWGGHVMFYNYSHTFEQLIPPEEYFDAHPEYFSFFDGKRQKKHTQLCLTNPDVLALCVEGVRGWMRKHPECDIFSVAQNDWYGYCECPECRAVDERERSHAGTMIAFVNAVADAIRDEFPGKLIHTFAYLYTRKAPAHLRPRPNVIVRLCPIECCYAHPIGTCDQSIASIDVEEGAARRFEKGEESFAQDLADWSRICDRLYIWDYTTNFANYCQPFPNLSVLAPNLRLFRRYGVKGVFEQGNYAPGNATAFGAMKIYLLSKLLWNPDADENGLIDEFLRGYYGDSAAKPLRDYIALMENEARKHHMGVFDPPSAPYLSEDALNQGEALMKRALSLADTPARRERVEREALSVEYAQLARLPARFPGRKERFAAFREAVERLGITELFERRELQASLDCLESSQYATDRKNVPYQVYRL